jgi:hypothetical protein
MLHPQSFCLKNDLKLRFFIKNVNNEFRIAHPQFFLLFVNGLDKPLSKASSGQSSCAP